MPSGRRRRVDVEVRVGATQAEQPDQLLDDLECLRLGLGLVGALDRVVHEDHVGVAAVALLATPEPAHADDQQTGERRCARAFLEGAQAHLEGDLEQRRGEVGHGRPEVVERQGARQVGDGDPEQLGPADGAGGEHRGLRVVLAPGRGPHPAQHVLAGAGLEPRGVPEELHALRRLLEQVRGEAAAGEGVGEPLGRRALVAEQPEVPVRRAELVADLAEGEQPGIRIGLVGEPAEHHRQQLALDQRPTAQPAGECLEVT